MGWLSTVTEHMLELAVWDSTVHVICFFFWQIMKEQEAKHVNKRFTNAPNTFLALAVVHTRVCAHVTTCARMHQAACHYVDVLTKQQLTVSKYFIKRKWIAPTSACSHLQAKSAWTWNPSETSADAVGFIRTLSGPKQGRIFKSLVEYIQSLFSIVLVLMFVVCAARERAICSRFLDNLIFLVCWPTSWMESSVHVCLSIETIVPAKWSTDESSNLTCLLWLVVKFLKKDNIYQKF